MDFMLQSLK